MSTTSLPPIPPRPVRGQKEQQQRPSVAENDMPRIPPRPARRTDHSTSPQRDSFAPSPLNEPKFVVHNGSLAAVLQDNGGDTSGSTLPPRPPSVTLPSIGQEGTEYASFYEKPVPSVDAADTDQTAKPATRNIGTDLELHAPKPALPTSSAEARVSTVTRTDSSQAAAAGIGKPHEDDKDPHTRPLKARASFASHHSTASTERASSTQPGDSEQGIPEIGQRVPMYPHAGDVQAPSPAPYAYGSVGPGAGSQPEGQHRAGRHHGRTRSGRETFYGPPGSYGLHGHGTPIHDKFEKAWYEKHPDALGREGHGEYGPGLAGGRGAWALSREDLDRIVWETASKGAGVGKWAMTMCARNLVVCPT